MAYLPSLSSTDGSKVLVSGSILQVSGTITNGTLGLITRVGNIGTIESGTVTTTLVLNTGTITTIVAGTQQTLGTVGVVNNVVTGTLANSGTTTGVGVVTSVTNLVGGTVTALALGTVKINATPAGSTPLTNHVLGTAGAGAFWGTLLATAGAGTNVYLSGLQIVVHSGTPECAITNNVAGSTGAGVYARGVFPPGGGIARDLSPAIMTGAAGTLAYLINAGTASFIVNYWVSP